MFLKQETQNPEQRQAFKEVMVFANKGDSEANMQADTQKECDHDWEYLEYRRVCTYPECQKEESTTATLL
jgi:hypothetical protein